MAYADCGHCTLRGNTLGMLLMRQDFRTYLTSLIIHTGGHTLKNIDLNVKIHFIYVGVV